MSLICTFKAFHSLISCKQDRVVESMKIEEYREEIGVRKLDHVDPLGPLGNPKLILTVNVKKSIGITCRLPGRVDVFPEPVTSQVKFLLFDLVAKLTRWSAIRGQFHQHSTSSFYAFKSQKCNKAAQLDSLFVLLVSAGVTAARRTLMKLTPGWQYPTYSTCWPTCQHPVNQNLASE